MRAALLLAALAGTLLVGCVATSGRRQAPAAVERARVATLLEGSFSSAAQAELDPDNYLDIRLHVVPIWTARSDGPWLYVEQAAARALDRPYRQRVYHVVGGGDEPVASVVYELPGDPLVHAGAWRAEAPLASLGPDDLLELPGCTVVLEPVPDAPGHYRGGTVGEGCLTQWGDAVHATSEVALSPSTMESWDRGYDADGVQVWGATEGPYRFVRQVD